eukprot:TRINITY_DN12091_c0_g1_i2.p3 TRINITY_DN12091_c0_g1~~TRINITY_DN12091_c0_g1_i2.p3  ORF type:complete len:117 (+),score=14.48 TRINITY_DN12091_c0_g1_i2:343-693(+)
MSRPATASGMRWEEGRYQAEDGSVVLSAEEALPPRPPASTAAPVAAAAAPQAPAPQPSPPPATKIVAREEVAVVKPAAAPVMPACGTGLRGIRNLRRNRHPVPDHQAAGAPPIAAA